MFSRLSCPEFDQLNDQNKFCYMLTRTHVARIVGQFIIDAFDNRPVKIWLKVNLYMHFCRYFHMYFHMYFWMYFLAFKYSISLVPVGIPSIDLYFLIFDYFCVHSHAIEDGWSVQVHFGGGLLKTTSFVWIYLSSIYFQARLLSNIIIKCPSMVFC